MDNSIILRSDVMKKIINVADDFSIIPSGRQLSDGSATGQHFYQILVDSLSCLSKGEQLTINFDGVLTAGSSFLDEAFAGLVRNGIISKKDFHKAIVIIANEHPEIKEKISKYVKDV